MPEFSLFNVAVQAEQMRGAQKLYFILIAKAKKTKLADDYAAANKALKTSKQCEVAFDDTIQQILNAK